MSLPVSMFGNAPGVTQQLKTNARLVGSGRRPDPPCSIMAQPGPNCLIVTWSNQGTAANALCSTRVYLDVESNLFATLAPGCVYTTIPATGGPNPPVRAFYLSFITPGGVESRKVQGKGSAAPQANGAAPPTNPQPPSGAGTVGAGSAGNGNNGRAGRPISY